MSSETLQEAYRLIREGNKQGAARLLVPFVRAEPLNADGWWLLANALEDPDRQRRALEQVLKLRPDDERARKMLDRVQGAAPVSKPPPAPAVPAPIEVDTGEVFGEPFLEEPELFTDEPYPPVREVRVHRSQGSGCVTIALAIIGLIAVASCAVCVLTLTISAPTVSRVIQEIVLTVTAMPVLSVQVGSPTPAAPATMPTDLKVRGSIELGQTVPGTVDPFQDDAWTFSADADEPVVIDLTASDASLDPHLYLYAPDGRQIAENDDLDGSINRNSRITVTLTEAGVYTIRVSKFSGGGAYSLSLGQE